MKQFIKKEELQLLNGGYVSNKDGNPVSNTAFVEAQNHAHFVVTFAEKAKGKDFKGKKADDLNAFRMEIWNLLNGNKAKTYIAAPNKPKATVGDRLKEEALAFIGYQTNTEKAEKVNTFMQQFNSIEEFQTYGLFFEQEIVKLNKIYTIEEVLKAVTSVIDLV